MKNVLFLAIRYLRFNKIKTAIMVFSIAVAVFLPLAVHLLVRDYQRDLLARAEATPLIAGAPGSRFDSSCTRFIFAASPRAISRWATSAAINHSGLALAIPNPAKTFGPRFSHRRHLAWNISIFAACASRRARA